MKKNIKKNIAYSFVTIFFSFRIGPHTRCLWITTGCCKMLLFTSFGSILKSNTISVSHFKCEFYVTKKNKCSCAYSKTIQIVGVYTILLNLLKLSTALEYVKANSVYAVSDYFVFFSIAVYHIPTNIYQPFSYFWMLNFYRELYCIVLYCMRIIKNSKLTVWIR